MESKNRNWTYVIGGAAGALLGVAIAHALIKTSESDKKPFHVSAQSGLQIGIHTFNFAHRLINLLRKP